MFAGPVVYVGLPEGVELDDWVPVGYDPLLEPEEDRAPVGYDPLLDDWVPVGDDPLLNDWVAVE